MRVIRKTARIPRIRVRARIYAHGPHHIHASPYMRMGEQTCVRSPMMPAPGSPVPSHPVRLYSRAYMPAPGSPVLSTILVRDLLSYSRRRHPQLFVSPAIITLRATSHLFPQSQSQSHIWEPVLVLRSSNRLQTNRPKRRLVKSSIEAVYLFAIEVTSQNGDGRTLSMSQTRPWC